MNIEEIKIQLTSVLHNLPIHYSQNGARKLMSSFENCKHIVRGLPRNYSRMRFGAATEFNDIELNIRMALKGAPKKEAESGFEEAKRHITDDINSILKIAAQD